MIIITSFIYFILILLFNYMSLKNSFLLDIPLADKHKKKYLFSKKVPKILGLVILIFLIFNFNFSAIENLSLISIFFLGFLSDIKKINSPKVRFFIQFFIIIFYLFYSSNFISETKIFFIDNLLSNNFFEILFTLICIAIVINGSNFIDGLNTLCIGYYLNILIILYLLSNSNIIQFDQSLNIIIFFVICFFLI